MLEIQIYININLIISSSEYACFQLHLEDMSVGKHYWNNTFGSFTTIKSEGSLWRRGLTLNPHHGSHA